MKYSKVALLCFILIVFSPLLYGEIYRYQDTRNNTVYTNYLNAIHKNLTTVAIEQQNITKLGLNESNQKQAPPSSTEVTTHRTSQPQ